MTPQRARWSWASDRDEARRFEQEASQLVGQRLTAVRYITADHGADRYRGDASGPRTIELPDEWQRPSWVDPGCDSVDFAVEFRTASGARFTASWELPGTREGIGLRAVAAVGSAVRSDADVAIWDVSQRSGWREFLHSPVEAVDLRYEPWDDTGALWCRRIDLGVAGRKVALLLAEGSGSGTVLRVAADNVAVVFGPALRPPW